VRTAYPLAEARVLYELSHGEATEVADLRGALDVAAGQLSRLLPRLESDGVLAREDSPARAVDQRRSARRLLRACRASR
jgi:DNA-binding MarR family transcriptional regulator